MIQHIESQFSCDDCGTEFIVKLDPVWTLPDGWSLFDIAEDAIRRGLSYSDAAEYVVGRDSYCGRVDADGRHLCRRCAGKKGAK